jgi:hypothetical protein
MWGQLPHINSRSIEKNLEKSHGCTSWEYCSPLWVPEILWGQKLGPRSRQFFELSSKLSLSRVSRATRSAISLLDIKESPRSPDIGPNKVIIGRMIDSPALNFI